MRANTKFISHPPLPRGGSGWGEWFERQNFRKIIFAALLAATPAIATDQPDAELLEFLGGYEIEVDGEWVNPVSLDIEETSAEVAQDTTPLQRGKTHE